MLFAKTIQLVCLSGALPVSGFRAVVVQGGYSVNSKLPCYFGGLFPIAFPKALQENDRCLHVSYPTEFSLSNRIALTEKRN